MQAKGGGLGFIRGNRPSLQQNVSDGEPSDSLLVYINGDHEYVVFDPHGEKVRVLSLTRRKELVALEDTGRASFNLVYYFNYYVNTLWFESYPRNNFQLLENVLVRLVLLKV